MNLQPLRPLIAWLGALLGLILLVGGLFVPDTGQWRLQLLAGLWLLSLLPRLALNRQSPSIQRGLVRLALVFGLGFGAVALQLTRDQISQAEAIRRQAVAVLQPTTAESPPAPAGPALRSFDRTSLGSQRVWPVTINTVQRGTIVGSGGAALAVTQDGRRVYPHIWQITGFHSRLYGSAGVEGTFDDYLSGARAISPTVLLRARLLGTPVQQISTTVRLTIHGTLQYVAQNALGERPGAVVFLDVPTGAILVLATYPRYDPNQLVLPDQATEEDVARVQAAWKALMERPDSPLLNRATQGRYPPGSVIKTLTAAAALDAGVVAGPEGRVTCPNRLPTEAGAPPVINALENLARFTGDPSDLRRVFAFSCNTAFAQLGLALGPDRFAQYAERFGLRFADAVSVTADLRDFPADVGTIAGTRDFLQRPAALADTAFGQGQALVTPLDMAQMVAAIGNDGRLMRPFLVQDVRAGDQVLYTAQPEQLRQVISPQAAQQLRSIMQTSVEIGYAKPVALPGVAIGAKTGTAEAPGGAPHSWFVALAPIDAPRFAIAVIVEHGGEGSKAALPVARQVLAVALGVKP